MELCQVCGAPDARLYYRAVVCKPCRVFFYRCSIFQPPKPCDYQKNCDIIPCSAENKKKNCAYCRYKKCTGLDMNINCVRKKIVVKKNDLFEPAFINLVVKAFHFPLFQPTMQPAELDTIILFNRMSMNELGESPSLTRVNDTANLEQLLINPSSVVSRDTRCFDQLRSTGLTVDTRFKYDLKKNLLREVVSFVDLLNSTHYFKEFNANDQIRLIINNFPTFRLFSLLECRFKVSGGNEMWINLTQKWNSSDEKFMKLLARAGQGFNHFFTKIALPFYWEHQPDDAELMAIKIIAIFTSPIPFSEDGMKKASFMRDLFTLKLSQHISNTKPELTAYQHHLRLKNLLGFIPSARKSTELTIQCYAEAFFNRFDGLFDDFLTAVYVKSPGK